MGLPKITLKLRAEMFRQILWMDRTACCFDAGVLLGRIGTDAFPGVNGNVYKSLFEVLSGRKDARKTEYAVIRWYNDCKALVLFTGLRAFLCAAPCRGNMPLRRRTARGE